MSTPRVRPSREMEKALFKSLMAIHKKYRDLMVAGEILFNPTDEQDMKEAEEAMRKYAMGHPEENAEQAGY